MLGISLEQGNGRVHDASPALDRLDNAKGYVKGNVVVISYKANRMKSNATIDEIVRLGEWARTLAA